MGTRANGHGARRLPRVDVTLAGRSGGALGRKGGERKEERGCRSEAAMCRGGALSGELSGGWSQEPGLGERGEPGQESRGQEPRPEGLGKK